MIEVFSFFGLIISFLLSMTNLVCSNFLTSAINAILIFIVFARCLITIAYDLSIPDTSRIMQESLILFFATICQIMLFSYYKLNILTLLIIVYTVCFIMFLSIKVFLFKKNIYGEKYIFWQIVDIFLTLTYIASSILLNYKYSFILIIFIFVNGICLMCVNRYILNKTEYWISLNSFKEIIKTLIIENKVKSLTYPPERNLEKDLIFSKCVVILKYSTFRIIGCYYLQSVVKEILIKNNFSKKEAQLISSKFLGILTNNLMRRKLDASLLPSKIINKFYNLERKIKSNKSEANL